MPGNPLDGRSSHDLIITDSHNGAYWISKCRLSCPVIVPALGKTNSISFDVFYDKDIFVIVSISLATTTVLRSFKLYLILNAIKQNDRNKTLKLDANNDADLWDT